MSSDDVISMVRQELKDPEKRKKPSLICEKVYDLFVKVCSFWQLKHLSLV